jgi:hypothetical protein
MPRIATDESYDADAEGAYAEVSSAADRKRGPFGVLQKLERAFLRWDDGTADKAVTRELRNHATMPLSEDNCTWPNLLASRECLGRAINSSHENDPNRPDRETPRDAERVYGEKNAGAYEAREKVRALFRDAMPDGARDEAVAAAIKAAKGKDESDAD